MNDTPYKYRAFDLSISSELPLVGFFKDSTAADSNEADINVRYGSILEPIGQSYSLRTWVTGYEDGFICKVPGGGAFQFSRSGAVHVDLSSSSEIPKVSDYLAGYGLPSFLHYTDAVPMHMSVVQTPKGCWAFAGESGAGKSTTAALVSNIAGWDLLCDDICAMRICGDKIKLSFGFNRFKVWRDSAALLGLDTGTLEADPARPDKFMVRLSSSVVGPVKPLLGIIFLEWGVDRSLDSSFEVRQLTNAHGFMRTMNSVHSSYFCMILDRQADCMRVSKLVVETSNLLVVQRSIGMAAVEKIIKIIEHS